MILYQEAVAILRELGLQRLMATEVVPIEQACGRVLAESVSSGDAIPPFDNSAMDGFAVAAQWIEGARAEVPVELSVHAAVFAGDALELVASGIPAAIEIMTGAPIPPGPWDSVVKIEDVLVQRGCDGRALKVIFSRPVETGAHIRRAGEDFLPGQAALERGTQLGPEDVLGLATLGVSKVKVRRKPKVAVINTGRELVPHSVARLPFGKIRNSTGPFLEAALPFYGCNVTLLEAIEDDPAQFEGLIRRILGDGYDLVLTTGAVSMGQADFIGESLRKLGAEILFHKVAIRPGKPVLCARFAGESAPVFIGLPGNPVSTAVGLRFFVSVYLRGLLGLVAETTKTAVLTEDVGKPAGLRCFFKGALLVGEQGLRTESLRGQASFMVSPLLRANCWIVLPEDGGVVKKGSAVQVWPLIPEPREAVAEKHSDGKCSGSRRECC